MKTRFTHAVILAAMIVLLSGCPVPTIAPGVWLFTFDKETHVGIVLLNGGLVREPNPWPPEADHTFAGESHWSQTDSQFLMTQFFDGAVIEYVGTITSGSNIIDGVYTGTFGMDTDSGTWVAERLRS